MYDLSALTANSIANSRHSALMALGVALEHRLLQAEEGLAYLLAKPALDAGARATVVQAVGFDLIDVCMAHGYHCMDLLVLHPETPELQALQAHCAQPHTHTGDEVRYVLDGAGVYSFFDAAGQEHTVHVGPGDYLRIPAGVEHRFTLTSARRIKALRLFSDAADGVKQYTARAAAPVEMAASA